MDYVLIFAYYTNTMEMSHLKIYLKVDNKIRIILNSNETIVLCTMLTWDDSCMAHNQNKANEQNIMQWKQRENLAQQSLCLQLCLRNYCHFILMAWRSAVSGIHAMHFYKWLSSLCGYNYDYAFISNQNCDKNWQECCFQEKIFSRQVKLLATVQDPTYRQTWLLTVYALCRFLNKFL